MTSRTCFLALTLSACATTQAPAPVAPEPLPPPALVLRVTPDLPPLTLSCRAVDETLPNGLDDDCDGSIDGLPRASALTVTWTNAPGTEVDVWLRDEQGNVLAASQESHTSGCATETTATSARVFANPPAGPAQLVVLAKPCTASEASAAAKVPVVLSMGEPTGSHAYLLSLSPGELTTLGAYVAP